MPFIRSLLKVVLLAFGLFWGANLSVCAWGANPACKNFPIFFIENSVLDLPCVDIDRMYCYRAKLELVVEKDEIWLEVAEFSGTREPLPTGEDRSYIPTYNPEDQTVHFPYIALSSDLSTYEVQAKVEEIFGGEIILKVTHIERKLLPQNLCSDKAKGSCDVYTSNPHLHVGCQEYSGTSLGLRVYSLNCSGIFMYDSPCPTEGAIASCLISKGNYTYTSYFYADVANFLQTFINGCELSGGELELLRDQRHLF